MKNHLIRRTPLLVGCGIAVAAWCRWIFPGITPDKDVLGAGISVASILTGFLTTAMSIIVGLSGTAIQRINQTGYGDIIRGDVSESIIASVAFCLVGFSGYFIAEATFKGWHYWAGWHFFAFWSLSSFLRLARVMMIVIKVSAPK